MPQTQSRLFDDLARLMTDAAGLAQGARREVDAALRSQFERFVAGMDFVTREEFNAVQEMAARARTENAALQARIEALESRLDSKPDSKPDSNPDSMSTQSQQPSPRD